MSDSAPHLARSDHPDLLDHGATLARGVHACRSNSAVSSGTVVIPQMALESFKAGGWGEGAEMPDGNIGSGRPALAVRADLNLVGLEAGTARGGAGAGGGAERVGNRLEQAEILAALHAAP